MKMMMTTTMVAGLVVAGMATMAEAGCGTCSGDKEHAHAKPEIKTQTTCPVMGGKTNANLYVDHEGKRVYVCCKGCLAPLKKNPEKYIDKLEDQGVTVTKIQTTCPVMGGKINKELYADHDGKRVYFCCPMCEKAFAKDPEKYIEKLKKEGVTLDPVPKDGAEEKADEQMPHGHMEHHH